MNPLDWTGPEFLGLYVPLLAAALLAGLWLRWWLRQPGGITGTIALLPGPYEVATLRSRAALVEAALASLSHQGLIRVEGGKLAASGKVAFTAPLIERVVHAAVDAGDTQQSELVRKAEPAIEQLRVPLVRRGWLVDETWSLRARLLPVLPGLAVLLLGFLKMLVGLERHRPVAFLVLGSILLGLWIVWNLGMEPWRSRLGDAALEELRLAQVPLKQTASAATSASALNSRDVALTVGLYGLTAVGFHELEDVRRYMESSSYGGTGGSVDGGGDGGGGDGGCGGGGCGGCGGGGD